MDKKRVLFIGNSITRHEPAPDIGWHGSWGMAASCEQNDYVHLMVRLFKKANIPVEYMLKNIADFERSFWDYDFENLKALREFAADIIIMRIAENVSKEEAACRNFGKYFDELIRYIDPKKMAMVICSNGFGEHDTVNAQIKEAAEKNGFPLADLSALFFNDENKALREFTHEGVNAHPSDAGMATIANILFSHIMREVGRQK